MPDNAYQEAKEKSRRDANRLALAIIQDLEAFAKAIPAASKVSRSNYGSSHELDIYGIDDATFIGQVKTKVSEVYQKNKGFQTVVYVTVRGGHCGRRVNETRSQVYRVGSIEKLANVKVRLQAACKATVEHEKMVKRSDMARKETNRKTRKILKDAGFSLISPWSGEESEDDSDHWDFAVDVHGKKDGLSVRIQDNGEIHIRLPDDLTLADFLKRLA